MNQSFEQILSLPARTGNKSEGGRTMRDTFTVGELAAAVTGGNERAMRRLLNDAGADPRLDEYAANPVEPVAKETVIDLLALHAGDRVGRLLADLLRE
jgi:hypothetical protein